MNILLVKCQDL